jgi:hypothetical protein
MQERLHAMMLVEAAMSARANRIVLTVAALLAAGELVGMFFLGFAAAAFAMAALLAAGAGSVGRGERRGVVFCALLSASSSSRCPSTRAATWATG